LKSPIRIAAASAVILLAGDFTPTANLQLGALHAESTEEMSFQQNARLEITNSIGGAAPAGLSVRDMRVHEFLQWKDLTASNNRRHWTKAPLLQLAMMAARRVKARWRGRQLSRSSA
jgi:hypothetical protein